MAAYFNITWPWNVHGCSLDKQEHLSGCYSQLPKMRRTCTDVHTSLACLQRQHKYSVWWRVSNFTSEVFAFDSPCRSAQHLLSPNGPVKQLAGNLDYYTITIYLFCHILRNHTHQLCALSRWQESEQERLCSRQLYCCSRDKTAW